MDRSLGRAMTSGDTGFSQNSMMKVVLMEASLLLSLMLFNLIQCPNFPLTGPTTGGNGKQSPPSLGHSSPLSALEMTKLALFKMYNQQQQQQLHGQANLGGPLRDLVTPPESAPTPGKRSSGEQQQSRAAAEVCKTYELNTINTKKEI